MEKAIIAVFVFAVIALVVFLVWPVKKWTVKHGNWNDDGSENDKYL